MDKNDVIRIAMEVSINFANRSDECTLIEFAEAIASAEREECAKVCDKHASSSWNDDRKAQAKLDASEIRMRSNGQSERGENGK